MVKWVIRTCSSSKRQKRTKSHKTLFVLLHTFKGELKRKKSLQCSNQEMSRQYNTSTRGKPKFESRFLVRVNSSWCGHAPTCNQSRYLYLYLWKCVCLYVCLIAIQIYIEPFETTAIYRCNVFLTRSVIDYISATKNNFSGVKSSKKRSKKNPCEALRQSVV